MSIYVQLKDEIAFASVESDNPIEGAIELAPGLKVEDVIGKKFKDGSWSEPATIVFAKEVLDNGTLMAIGETIFSSLVDGEVIDESVKVGFRKVADSWVDVQELKKSSRPENLNGYFWDDEKLTWEKINSVEGV